METFKFIQPSPVLAPFVKHYWILETDGINPVLERIIPTGFMQMVFHRGERMNSLSDDRLQPQSFICGQSSCYTDLASTGRISMIVVVFHPFGSKAFFHIPMNLFRGKDVSLADLSDKSLYKLEDRIYNEADDNRAIALIESELILRLRTCDSYNLRRIKEVIKAINLKHQPSVTSLSETACLSYKQFNRIFTEYVGTSPKEFTRIIRFQRALHILQNTPEISITELAFDCGYYDQPHLIKEFKAFSGYTPPEFMAHCRPYSDYFS